MHISTEAKISFDKWCDFIPVVSTAANLYVLALKAIWRGKEASTSLDEKFINHVKSKNLVHCLFLLIPGVNFLVALAHKFLVKVSEPKPTDPKALGGVNKVSEPKPLPPTDPRVLGVVYKLIKDFHEVCQIFDVKYWGEGGTALGAIRHKGIIPHDDDGDLQLAPGEELKLANEEIVNGMKHYKVKPKVEEELKKRGLKLERHWGGWKLCPINYPTFAKIYHLSPERSFCWPFIDIFISKTITNNPKAPGQETIVVNTLANASENNNVDWSFDYWLPENINNLQKVPFGPISIMIPDKPQDYLARDYGNNWATHAYLIFDHATGKKLDKKLVKITDFSPGEYDENCFQGKWESKVDTIE